MTERTKPEEERRTANDERRTTNGERRTTNGERRTANGERRTANDERRSGTTERRRKKNDRTMKSLDLSDLDLGLSLDLRFRIGYVRFQIVSKTGYTFPGVSCRFRPVSCFDTGNEAILAFPCIIDCSTKSIYCCSDRKTLDAKVIQQSWVKGRSTSSKLESIDVMIVDVIDLLSKPFPSINVHPQLGAQSFVGQDELALAKEGLQKIFDNWLIAVADPKVQEKFLLYSATLLSAESCPSELKVNLSSFRCNLLEETSAFIKAEDELKVASDLSASITQKKFVVRQQTSKYDEVKKEIVASDEKVSNFKAMIKELKAQIKRLEACLATEESNRAKNDEAIDSIEKQVTTARDGLVSDLAQVSSMEGSTQAANELVARKQSDWDNLKLSFTKFA